MEDVVKETLNPHFMRMISTSIFVPFMHEETPKSGSFPGTQNEEPKASFVPETSFPHNVIQQRTKLLGLMRD